MTYDEIKDKLVDNFSVREKLINITDQTDTRPGNELNRYLGGEPIEVQYNDTSFTVKEWYIESPNKQVHQSGYYAQVFSIEYHYTDFNGKDNLLVTQWYKEGDLITPPEGVDIYNGTAKIYEFVSWLNIPHYMTPEHIIATASYRKLLSIVNIYVNGGGPFSYLCNIGSRTEDFLEDYFTNHTNVPRDNLYILDEYPELVPDYDITIRMVSKNQKYTVSFYNTLFPLDATDEEMKQDYGTYTYVYGERISPPQLIRSEWRINDDYVFRFSHWFDEVKKVKMPVKMPSYDMYCEAVFEEVYEPVGGSEDVKTYNLNWYIDDEIIHTDKLKEGDKIVKPSKVDKLGSSLRFTSDVPELMPANDLDIYATTSTNTYKLSYYVYDTLVNEVQYQCGEAIEVYTPNDARFVEWETSLSVMPAHDTTLSAVISRSVRQYTASYYYNNEVVKTETLYVGQALNPPVIEDVEFIMNGHLYMPPYNITFYGRSTAESGGGGSDDPVTPPGDITELGDMFNITAQPNGESTHITLYGASNFEATVDNITWNTLNFSYGPQYPVGTKIYIRAKNPLQSIEKGSMKIIRNNGSFTPFVVKCEGNINSLFGDTSTDIIPGTFKFPFSCPIFNGDYNEIIHFDISDIILCYKTLIPGAYGGAFSAVADYNSGLFVNNFPKLPAVNLAEGCYMEMFSGCYNLVNAPELPATTLAEKCYMHMFAGCSSLVNAPALPATTLTDWCYTYMFSGCSSLVNAPALPATTLASCCYQGMFVGASLVNAPSLPATTLTGQCYYYMFSGCSELKNITIYAQDISAYGCLAGWVFDVSSTGTFRCKQGVDYPLNSKDGIPSGWTVEYI